MKKITFPILFFVGLLLTGCAATGSSSYIDSASNSSNSSTEDNSEINSSQFDVDDYLHTFVNSVASMQSASIELDILDFTSSSTIENISDVTNTQSMIYTANGKINTNVYGLQEREFNDVKVETSMINLSAGVEVKTNNNGVKQSVGFEGKNMNNTMYIDHNNKSRCVSKTAEGWVPARATSGRYYGGYTYFANPQEAKNKCKRIKYILESAAELRDECTKNFLVTALRFSDIEQMCKLGYTDAMISITASSTPKAELKSLFGGYYNEKAKNLLKKINMTKPQLDYHMTHKANGYYSTSDGLEKMRNMFGNDLTYIDIESFKKYYEGCKQICRVFWGGLDRYTRTLGIEEMKFFKNLVRLSSKAESVYNIANDTINAYTYLDADARPEIDWYFDDISDLVRAHDALTELRRRKEAEWRARWDMSAKQRLEEDEKHRQKVDEKRKEYEYEDEEYIIRLPKDLNEIVNEGNIQSICIGGYTDRHARGNTNIFFMRKKNCEEIPFYAIEMTNDKSIVQIHGHCNQWLGCHPEAIPTVVRWLRKNGIQCDEKILTCKAKGYRATKEYVPMPIVD